MPVRSSACLLVFLAAVCAAAPAAGQTVQVSYGAARLPAAVGEPVSFIAFVSGFTEPVEYQVWRLGPDGWHGQPYAGSATSFWTPAPSDVGTHLVQIWVRRVGSTAAYEAWGATPYFEVLAARPPTVTLLASTSARVAGTPITWTAIAEGGSEPFEYRFVRLDASGWKEVQAYGPTNTYTWIPTLTDVGSHVLQVWIREAHSTLAYDAWTGTGTFSIAAPSPPQVLALTASGSVPPRVGAATTWTAAATGGLPPLEYRFVRRDSDGWKEVQAYGSSSTYTWIPGVGDGGEHVLQVWVRSAGSGAAYDAWSGTPSFTVAPAARPEVTALAANVPLPSRPGVPVTWTASASGGTNLEYRFVRHDPDGWKEVQPYGTSSSYTWVPSEADAGPHALQVWVRNEGSSAPYDAWLGTGPFEIQIDATAILRAPAPVSVAVGGNSIWTADVHGLSNPEFEFRRRDWRTNSWVVVQPYSPRNVYFWIPAREDIGTHAVSVRVRPAGSSLPSAAQADGPLFTVTEQIPITLSMDRSGPIAVGDMVTFATPVPSSSNPLEYRFWRRDSSGSWLLAQDFSATHTHSWRPGVLDLGTHSVQVFVRVPGSSDSFQGWAGTGPFEVVCPAAGAVTVTADLYRSAASGERALGFTGSPIVFSAHTCGLPGTLEYQFLRVSSGGSWVVRDYAASDTFAWTPTASEANAAIEVRVRRTGAGVMFEQRDMLVFDIAAPAEDRSLELVTPPFTAAVGQQVTVVDVTTNLGPVPTSSGCSNTYMLNATIVGSRYVPALLAGESQQGSVSFTVPPLPPGSYWLFVYTQCGDVGSSNNMRWIGVRIIP